MQSALLAALALCNLPIYLYPQHALPDVAWPTHAVVALPRGWAEAEQRLFVLENDRPMLAQVEVATRWPDGSPKWLHVHGSFRYEGGEPAQYRLTREPPPAEMPESPLLVTQDERGIHIDTGAIRLLVPRPFSGIALLEHEGQAIFGAGGGPGVIDGKGTAWHAMHDRQAKVVLEQNGPAQVTVKATGWYQTPQPRDDAFCRFTTRITAFAGSSIVKIDHATTFAADMREHDVAELAFSFPLAGATGFSSSTYRGTFDEKLLAAYLAQLTDDRAWRIAQTGPDAQHDIEYQGDYERLAGWFSASVGSRRVALLTKDFWQKCPKEVKLSPDELVYYAWPKHGRLAPPDPSETRLENIYKFRCFHTGALLTSHLPEVYFHALKNQQDTTESKAEYAQGANLNGVSIRNEFALAIVPDTPDPRETDAHLERLQQLYLQSPTARVSPAAMAASGIWGPVATAGDDYQDIEETIVRGMLGVARSIARYGDYGWGIYGNIHHGQLMDPKAAGVPGGRPSLHRVWNNNHYGHVGANWRVWALNGDARLLQWARTATDNLASIGQCRQDAELRWHRAGAFYHCKGFVPWGRSARGVPSTDADTAVAGHWVYPSALLFAWWLDGDRWAKDGYDLWLEKASFSGRPRLDKAREANNALVEAIWAYRYTGRADILEGIRGRLLHPTRGFLSQPLLTHNPGPLWAPEWLSMAYELFSELEPAGEVVERLKPFILESADAVGTASGNWTLALSATAYELSGDDAYLRQHAGTLQRFKQQLFQDTSGRWQDSGLGPGPLGDRQFPIQWGRFLYALRKAKIADLPPLDEPGHYLAASCRYDNQRDVRQRGTRILMLHNAEEPIPLSIEASNVSLGPMRATSFLLLDGAGRTIWQEPRFPQPAGRRANHRRPSTWQSIRQPVALPIVPPGLYQLRVGSQEVGVFQGVAGGLPECQTLQKHDIGSRLGPVRYRCKITTGWLVPLTDQPISLKFTAISRSTGSYVAITPREGPPGARHLLAGESATVPLHLYPPPWRLEIFGDGSSATEIEVHSPNFEPLLYGSNLQDIRLIQQHLEGQRSLTSSPEQ